MSYLSYATTPEDAAFIMARPRGIKSDYPAESAIWRGMKRRCYDETFIKFHDYGGRGIKVCDRWLGPDGFENFISDMGPRPTSEHSLDRFPDINGDYKPDNCRWATREEQGRGKRSNVWGEYNGERLIMADWIKKLGVKKSTFKEQATRKGINEAIIYFHNKIKCTTDKTKKIE